MAFRFPRTLILALLLGPACRDADLKRADTAFPPEADTDTDADADSDTDADSEPATAQGLCDAVFALCDDDWGWGSEQICYESWLGEGQDWECHDIQAYLFCAAPCLDASDCEAFGACEVPCWDDHCL
jgi:hypothetical protein